MRTLTIYQPWASLIALGEKKIETRRWATSYRGPLAIHAGKTNFTQFGQAEPFRSAIEKHGLYYKQLPTGAVIAICNLTDCLRIQITDIKEEKTLNPYTLSDKERAFGDFTSFRYAWLLDNIKMLPEPIPTKGKQGLWNWEKHL